MNAIGTFIRSVVGYNYAGVVFILQLIGAVASVFLTFGIVYAFGRTRKILERQNVLSAVPTVSQEDMKQKSSAEWKSILQNGNSDDENERKIALIAADTLVENILGFAGYPGENLGERLKTIEPSDFLSLNDVWEAHKIRNRIAHEADVRLSKDETIQALSKFESALRELHYL